jgi:2-oxo-4-hydroxy-4-carboxy-5-ureidoimidazoline decarboxylase
MADPSTYLDGLDAEEARRELLRCCGSQRWADAMTASRPFLSGPQLKERARLIWGELCEADFREAFAHHPEIGADLEKLRAKFTGSLAWSNAEQAGVNTASEATLEALRDANVSYRRRFGYIFIVCATGKTADEMLALIRARLLNAPDLELRVAAEEQAKITELRLEKLGP